MLRAKNEYFGGNGESERERTSSMTYVVCTMTHQSCTHQISSMGNATLKL